MNQFAAAVIQLDSQDDYQKNLEYIRAFVEEAARKGAKLVALPEMMNYVGGGDVQEAIPDGETFRLLADLAKKHQIWIHGGTIHEKNDTDPDRPYNTTMVIDPFGNLAAKYRKVHPSDMDFPGAVKESDMMCPGDELVNVNTKEVGNLGLSICYDMRFAELYRLLTLNGAQILIIPALFYTQTGKDHWETILRTRAIENGCYVLAPGQVGAKKIMGTTIQAYGKSMIIDPWGDVVARASDKPGVIIADVDLEYLEFIRKKTSTLKNRRSDLYELKVL